VWHFGTLGEVERPCDERGRDRGGDDDGQPGRCQERRRSVGILGMDHGLEGVGSRPEDVGRVSDGRSELSGRKGCFGDVSALGRRARCKALFAVVGEHGMELRAFVQVVPHVLSTKLRGVDEGGLVAGVGHERGGHGVHRWESIVDALRKTAMHHRAHFGREVGA